MPICQYTAQSGHCLGRGFAKLEDLCITHVGNQLLRPLAERIYLFGLFHVLQERLLVRVILELLNQLSDSFSAICVLFFDCRMRDALYSVVDVAPAVGCTTTSRCTLV